MQNYAKFSSNRPIRSRESNISMAYQTVILPCKARWVKVGIRNYLIFRCAFCVCMASFSHKTNTCRFKDLQVQTFERLLIPIYDPTKTGIFAFYKGSPCMIVKIGQKPTPR